MPAKVFERLPTDVVPVNYNVSLKPDFKKFVFEGTQTVDVKVCKDVQTITLNSVEINIKDVKFNDLVGNIEYNTEEEKVVFKFPEQLKEGSGKLHINFTGQLNDNMKGFYRSKYVTEAGEEKIIGVTQFEATDARRAFPCWDEPSLKATFEISLITPQNLRALSNMPEVQRTNLDDGLVTVEFARTPVMSTYLVAMVVGEFDYVEARDTDGVLVRVYTALGKSAQGQFALDVACRTLPFYRDYFDIAYPLKKMDLIAIPDFAAGAMENWGLVTYRETTLLVDPKESSLHNKQYVALVVGHELAHQWFGNLVTMEWWTHLWLNEGFATWIEYLCVDYCYPEYDIWTQFTSSDFSVALDLDALKTSHAIEVTVNHPDEIDEIFDRISYSKGASIIRMLHDYLGGEKFRDGLRIYLKRHKYGNTRTEDLWTALEEASGAPVGRIMTTWTKQMGYPVVTLTPVLTEGKVTAVTLSQTRFLADGSADASKHLWLVPITLCLVDDPEKEVTRVVLEGAKQTFPLPADHSGAAVRANPGSVGVYRVRYQDEVLEEIQAALKAGKLPPRDRRGIQSDLFAMARAGLSSTLHVLRMVEGFSEEDNYTVWQDLAGNLATIQLLSEHVNTRPNYDKFICILLDPLFKKLGWDQKADESHNEKLLRPLILAILGKSGHAKVTHEARKKFYAHYSQSGDCSLPADVRAPVYMTILQCGSPADLEKMFQLYDRSDMSEEKSRILRNLGHCHEELLPRVFDFALSPKVRTQDRVFAICGCANTMASRKITWEFLRSNWPQLKESFSGLFLLSRLIRGVVDDFATVESAKEVETFFKVNPTPCPRAVEQAVENININAAQLSRDGGNLAAFFREHYPTLR